MHVERRQPGGSEALRDLDSRPWAAPRGYIERRELRIRGAARCWAGHDPVKETSTALSKGRNPRRGERVGGRRGAGIQQRVKNPDQKCYIYECKCYIHYNEQCTVNEIKSTYMKKVNNNLTQICIIVWCERNLMGGNRWFDFERIALLKKKRRKKLITNKKETLMNGKKRWI